MCGCVGARGGAAWGIRGCLQLLREVSSRRGVRLGETEAGLGDAVFTSDVLGNKGGVAIVRREEKEGVA